MRSSVVRFELDRRPERIRRQFALLKIQQHDAMVDPGFVPMWRVIDGAAECFGRFRDPTSLLQHQAKPVPGLGVGWKVPHRLAIGGFGSVRTRGREQQIRQVVVCGRAGRIQRDCLLICRLGVFVASQGAQHRSEIGQINRPLRSRTGDLARRSSEGRARRLVAP